MKVVILLALIACVSAQTVYSAILYEPNPVIRCFEPLTEYEFIIKFSQNSSASYTGLITTFHGFQGDYAVIYNTTNIQYYRFNLVTADTDSNDIYLWFYGQVWTNIVINKVSVRGTPTRYPPKGKIIYKEETTQLPLTLWVFKPNKTYTIEISVPYTPDYNITTVVVENNQCGGTYQRTVFYQFALNLYIDYNGFISTRNSQIYKSYYSSSAFASDAKNINILISPLNPNAIPYNTYYPDGCDNSNCRIKCASYTTTQPINNNPISYLVVIYEQ